MGAEERVLDGLGLQRGEVEGGLIPQNSPFFPILGGGRCARKLSSRKLSSRGRRWRQLSCVNGWSSDAGAGQQEVAVVFQGKFISGPGGTEVGLGFIAGRDVPLCLRMSHFCV